MAFYVYEYLDGERVIYVGKTIHPKQRYKEHMRQEKFKRYPNAKVVFKEVPNKALMDAMETTLIHKYQPELNDVGIGAGTIGEWEELEPSPIAPKRISNVEAELMAHNWERMVVSEQRYNKRINLLCQSKTYEKLGEYATDEGISRNALINQILKDYIREREEQQAYD